MRPRHLFIFQQCANEQLLLLSNLKMLIAVGNVNVTVPYLSSYEIESLITNIATL